MTFSHKLQTKSFTWPDMSFYARCAKQRNQTSVLLGELCCPFTIRYESDDVIWFEIMLTRGFWFQTLDVNKPWRQIPADRLLFLVFTHFFLITPRQYAEEKFRSNQTTLF